LLIFILILILILTPITIIMTLFFSQQLIDACLVESNPDLDQIRRLIRNGADINSLNDDDKWSPLLSACGRGHLAVVDILLQQPGIDINKTDDGAYTPLFMACQAGHELVVQRLLKERGISVNQATNEGTTPLVVACRNGHELVVQHLLQQPGIDIWKRVTGGGIHKKLLRRVFRGTAAKKSDALSVARSEGHTSIVDLLERHAAQEMLMQEAEQRAQQEERQQRLEHTRWEKESDYPRLRNQKVLEQHELFVACDNGHELVVQRLLQQPGIEINQASNQGATPLFMACQKGHELVVKQLLQQPGIHIHQVNNNGFTPLHIASGNGHVLVVQRLLQPPGIDVNQAMNDGATPLLVACQNGHDLVVQRLLEQPGIDVNRAINNGATPLSVACQEGHESVVQRLLQQPGIDIDARDLDGITPLHTASSFDQAEVAQLLLDHGAKVDAEADTGCTPLHAASLIGNTKLVQLLIDRGANIYARQSGSNGHTPLQAAKENGCEEIVQLLESYHSPFYCALFEKIDDYQIVSEKLENLHQHVGNVHEMKIFYTLTMYCQRHNYIDEQAVRSLLPRALAKAAETCIHEDAIVIFKIILEKANKDKWIDQKTFYRLDNRGEVKRMEHAPFIKDIQESIRVHASLINNLEQDIQQMKNAIVAIQSDIHNVCTAVTQIKGHLLRRQQVETTVAFISLVVNAVTFGVGGELVNAFGKLSSSVVDFGDLDHVLNEMNMHIDYPDGNQEMINGLAGPDPQDAMRELKKRFLAGVDLVGKQLIDGNLDRLLKEDNGMMILGVNAALGAPSATTHQTTEEKTGAEFPQVPAMIVTSSDQDTYCSDTVISNATSVLPIFPDVVLSDTDERMLPLHEAIAFGDKEVVEELLEDLKTNGGNVNALDSQGRTAQDLAALTGQLELVRLISKSGGKHEIKSKTKMKIIAEARAPKTEQYLQYARRSLTAMDDTE
jgi:ankyrin repeat protein